MQGKYKKNIQKKPYVIHLSDAYAQGWKGCPCVFTLSTGRAGTKTLTNVLGLSHDVVALHEPQPTLVKVSYDAFMENDISNLKSQYWDSIVLSARDDYVFNANQQGKIYIETNNRLTYLAETIARVFPDSRFIHLHRNPFEVIHSALRRKWYCDHPWDFARIRPKHGQPFADSWNSMTPLEKNAWYWFKVNEHILDFFKFLPQKRIFSLSSDLLFRADEQTINSLFQFIGVETPGIEKIKLVLSKKLNAQEAAPMKKKWSISERKIVRNIVQDIAFELGYVL